MTSDEALLRSIADELPYLHVRWLSGLDQTPGGPGVILRFNPNSTQGDCHPASKIYVYDGILHIDLYAANKRIDLATCGDPVKEIDKFIHKHMVLPGEAPIPGEIGTLNL